MAVTITFVPTQADVLRMSWAALRNRPLILAMGAGFFVVIPWAFAVWAIIESWRGNRHGLVFYFGGAPAFSLPTRVLSPADAIELRRLVVARGLEVRGSWGTPGAPAESA